MSRSKILLIVLIIVGSSITFGCGRDNLGAPPAKGAVAHFRQKPQAYGGGTAGVVATPAKGAP